VNKKFFFQQKILIFVPLRYFFEPVILSEDPMKINPEKNTNNSL